MRFRAAPSIPPRGSRGRSMLIVMLGALSAFGPLSIDFYLPALPELAAELGVDDLLAQATMAACLVGLAAGQLVVGPLSDRVGRRWPLLCGVALFVVTALACALAPTIEVLLVLRVVQGIAGSAGIVVCRAIVRDLTSGAEAARVFSLIMLVLGVAPVVAPLAGGALLLVMDWRALFVVLAGIGAVLFAGALVIVPDTLAAENRATGGAVKVVREFGSTLATRTFLFFVLALGANSGILFTYVSMSPLVYQEWFGLDPQLFAIVFALNAVGMVIGSRINAALVTRLAPRRILVFSLATGALGGAITLAAGVAALPFAVVLVGVAIATATHGLSMPNLNALGLEPFARGAGTASAVLGAMQFFAGGVIPVLVSGGGVSVTLMGGTMLASALVALALAFVAGRMR